METVAPDFAFLFAMNGTILSSWGGPNSSHTGYDFKGITNLEPVYASHSGFFTRFNNNAATCTSSTSAGLGGRIEHRGLTTGSSIYTNYHHLSSFALPNNTWVAAGDLIGYQGITGSSGCTYHLHQEFRKWPTNSGVYLKHTDLTTGISHTAGGPITFDGLWVAYGSWTTTANNAVWYGQTGDIPVLGDWNNDGYDTPGVVRVIQSGTYAGQYEWRLTNTTLVSASYGSALSSSYPAFRWGLRGDKVLVGDWDDDGDDTPAVVRVDSPGVLNSLTSYWITNNTTAGQVHQITSWGSYPGRWPIKGDWNGDGRDTPGVFFPQTAEWYLTNNIAGGALSYTPFSWGQSTALPMSGDWQTDNFDRPVILDKFPNNYQQSMTIFRKQYLSHVVGDLNSFAGPGLGFYMLVGSWDADGLDEYVVVQ